MTTKAISTAIGRPEKTVRTWAFKAAAKSAEAATKSAESTPSHPADWTLDETVSIIEIGLGKNAASIFRENAEHTADKSIAPESIAAIVRDTITAMLPVLIAAVRGAIPEQTVAMLPAPEPLTMRAQLRQIMASYGGKIGSHRDAWTTLYNQFYYRYQINIKQRAMNRGVEMLDYAESDGLLPQLLSLAASLSGGY